MATMKKSKQKKKNRFEQIPSSQYEAVDVQFPTVSTKSDNIISRECFVSAKLTTATITENGSAIVLSAEKGDKKTAEVRLDEESTPPEAPVLFDIVLYPSAPDSSEAQTIIRATNFQPFVKYPDLTEIYVQEQKTTVSVRAVQYENGFLKPFTRQQLKNFYDCADINFAKDFEIQFLSNSSEDNLDNHILFVLLKQYLDARSKIKINLMDISCLKKEIASLEPKVWVMQEKSNAFKGTCGDNLTATGLKKYEVAGIDRKQLETLSALLVQLHGLVCTTYTGNLVQAEITKTRIEQAVREIMCYPVFEKAYSNTSLFLKNNLEQINMACINHLRVAVSILFCFLRKPSHDKCFINEVKTWLIKLVSLQLRVATLEDHLFLLFHLLRCPSGMSLWGTSIIQVPYFNASDFKSLETTEVDHCMALLSILLSPVKKKNEFLRAHTEAHKDISDPVKDDLWIYVDSDGEDSEGECFEFKENDLVALLNQIPFERFFCCVLNIEKRCENYEIFNDTITGNQLMKIIAFNTAFIELLGEGLVTYNSDRYKQFTKRLGRLIGHCIHYIFDFHQLFMQNNLSKDPYLCERINVEFGSFVLKSCSYIYKTRNLGTWQYLSLLPFSSLHIRTIWELFYFLNVGFPEDLITITGDFECICNNSALLDNFNVITAGTSNDDLYYLLQTFLEMALAKDRITNWQFIKCICSHIFAIGFINASTREICYKTSRDMLTNLTMVHPDLISYLLSIVEMRFIEVEKTTYLFKSLPLEKWEPDIKSFETLSSWLLNYSYETNENILSRIVISRLNWEFNSANELFLSHEIHIRMACLICEAASKHVPEVIGLSGLSESLRPVSHLIDIQTTTEQFAAWCWNIISLLRLHYMDLNKHIVEKILKTPAEILKVIPDLDKINIVFQGVTENRPLPTYLSILLSSCGHSIPLICQKGFVQMEILLQDYRHAIVIRCLYLVTPLFLECPEILSNCASFQRLIKQLLNSDRTYMQMAKDLLLPNSPGPVLELLRYMIQAQITNYANYCLSSPTLIINLWLSCLTKMPNWKNPSVFNLIDIILKNAYQFTYTWCAAKEYFRFYYHNLEDGKMLRSAFQMFMASNIYRKFSISSADYAWFALITLEIEHEMLELETRLWPELLRQLRSSGKNNFDDVLKTTISIIGGPTYLSSPLVLFKYANIISTIKVNHQLLPIIAQNFFTLYLSRVPLEEDGERFQDSYGVADKFYESNISLMKKVKLKLKQAEDYYNNKSKNKSDENMAALLPFYNNLYKIFKGYLLWLEETSINAISKHQNIELPPQFNIDKLTLIFSGNEQHWNELLYLPEIQRDQKESATRWFKSCFRQPLFKKTTHNYTLAKHTTSPKDRVINQLKSYDKPVDPPSLKLESLILKKLNVNDVKASTLHTLKADFMILDDFARNFCSISREINALNGIYKDNITSLYTNIPYNEIQYAKCSSVFSKSILSCAKAAEVIILLEKPQKDYNIQRQIEDNREKHERLISLIISQNLNSFIIAMEKLKHIVRSLAFLESERQGKNMDCQQITDISIKFFNEIVQNLNENILSFAPTNEICLSLLSILGIFIRENQETQGVRILEMALKRPDLIKIFSDLFVPLKTSPKYFINMYKFSIDWHMRRSQTTILFILMSKFDLQNWLQCYRPRLSEINRLLKLILIGLENWNYPDAGNLQDLFRLHLVHIFEHEFPEHYGEVLQAILSSSAEQKLNPDVLLDLINSLLTRSGCEPLDFNINQPQVLERIKKFATQQNIFSFKSITDTMDLLARHFRNDRLHHGLHGLYPKHKNYCQALALLFACFSHAAVVSAIYTYSEGLADQISDYIFGPIIEMYSPWLVIYSGKELETFSASWMRQMIGNEKVLHPWSEIHGDTANGMIQSFVISLQYILDTLPVCSSIIEHVFNWYGYHFVKQNIPQHIRTPIHNALAQLPWDRFHPQTSSLDLIYHILHEDLPECHSFIGFIFLQVQWTKWMNETFTTWNPDTQIRSITNLFIIFIRLSFEPKVRDDVRTSKVLKEALSYPWILIENQVIENAFNWITISADPIIILKLQSESNSTNLAVLNLLKYASEMTHSGTCRNSFYTIQAKRIIYIRSVIRLLRSCGSKYQTLLQTKEGLRAFNDSLIELISEIDNIVPTCTENVTSRDTEAINLIVEVIGPLQTQSDHTSKLFVDALITWQSTCSTGNRILCNSLNAIGLCKSFTYTMYSLLEATINNYFQCPVNTLDQHSPTWTSVLQRLGRAMEYTDLLILFQGSFLFSLHTFIIHKLNYIIDIGEKITFLQDVNQLLENFTTTERTESRMALIWGLIICAGCNILQKSDLAEKLLLMLARYLQILASKSEGWSDGVLGVIGLKKDSTTNKLKILCRCLVCIIFSLFPDVSDSEHSKPNQDFVISMQDLKTITNSKKYSDVKILSSKAIEIVENCSSFGAERIMQTVSNIIKLFYNDVFLISVCDVWTF